MSQFKEMLRMVRNNLPIAVAIVLLVGLTVASAACAGRGAASPIKATWVKPQLANETIAITASEVTNNKIVHFTVRMALGNENFMAYEFDGKINVRANVCPPCRSVGFSLAGDKLICDTCKTVFKAQTGDGVSGACVAYPKAAVPFQNVDGKLVMQGKDLVAAYQNTLEQGWP